MLAYFKQSNPGSLKQLFLVHGDAQQMELLANDVDHTLVSMPEKGQTFELI
jgi:hypothetical protein